MRDGSSYNKAIGWIVMELAGKLSRATGDRGINGNYFDQAGPQGKLKPRVQRQGEIDLAPMEFE